MIVNNLKKSNGVSMVDVVIAIIILCMFVGTIGNLYYQIAYRSHIIQFNAMAVYYTVKIAEEIDRISYDEVKNELNNNLKDDFQIPSLINITIDVQKYSDIDTTKADIIKIVTIKTEYTALNNTETYEIKKLKIKEM